MNSMTTPLSWFQDLVYGRTPQLRLRVQRSMLAFLVYVVWMALEAYALHKNLIEPSHALYMISYSAVGVVGFYTLLRTGWSQRWQDPSITLAQMLYGIGAILMTYVLVPTTRVAAMQVLCLVLVFGLFTLRPREIIQISACALILTGLTLLGMWHWQIGQFDLRQDTINGLLACVVVPALAWTTHRYAQLREHLDTQKRDLISALDKIQTLATKDPLTGLYSRQHMTELLEQQHQRRLSSDAPLTLAVLDLDHFKTVNHTYGAQVGDEVLMGFARCCAELLRQPDMLARWGGQELLLIFPNATPEQAAQGLSRLRKQLGTMDLTSGSLGLRTTFSSGVAHWHPTDTLLKTLTRIDDALVHAKSAGRNRDVLAPED